MLCTQIAITAASSFPQLKTFSSSNGKQMTVWSRISLFRNLKTHGDDGLLSITQTCP